ncbi:MAG: alpha-L-fucosidase [Planctomycetota bacterium]|nr:alpha-L-fucosidase [Planctomycetota bacterium]
MKSAEVVRACVVAGLLSVLAAPPEPARAQASPPAESPAARDARMEWWREARFGMFIHWGLYAIPAGQWGGTRAGGTGEWILTNAKIPVEAYEPLRDRFNPVLFDADAWVRAAKRAGMKYIVITTKHHDGFALFDSAGTDWDIGATPFKRDVLKELAAACEREGVRLGFYYSIMDWHHPDYLPRRGWESRSADGADLDRYVGYMKGQLRELLTNYGQVGVLWFDGEWESTWTSERGKDLDAFVRSLQPSILVNNRVDKGRNDMAGLNRAGEWAGDFGTPEQEVPRTGLPGVDWESCMTMNDTWGYRSDDQNWKSSAELIRTLVDVASKGGNYLLNVGPTADGLIPEASLSRMADIARWMDVHAESIYATSAGPFKKLSWGRCTAKPGVLYLHVFDWPEGGLLRVPGLSNAPAGDATLLGSEAALPVRRVDDDLVIELPATPPDAPAPMPVRVVRLPIAGEPEVTVVLPRADAEGVIDLRPEDADITGSHLRYESKYGGSLGFWTNPEDAASWTFDAQPGQYWVSIEVSCTPEFAGSEFVVELGGTSFTGVVPSTGAWGTFTVVRTESILLEDGGPTTITVRPGGEFRGALMNLRAVRLTWAPGEVHEPFPVR